MNKAQQMLAKAGFPDTAAGRAAFHKQYPTPESFFQVHGGQDTEMYGAGSTIHIDPSKRGTFTAAATKHGKSVQGFASQVLANKEDYSPAMVKKANFARNAASWKHQDGGEVMYGPGGPIGISSVSTQRTSQDNNNYVNNYETSIADTEGFRQYYKQDTPGSYVHYAGSPEFQQLNVNGAYVNDPFMQNFLYQRAGNKATMHKNGGTVDALQLMGMPTPPMYGEGSFTGNPYNRFGRRSRNTGDDNITGFSTGFTTNYKLPGNYSSSGQSANVGQAATPEIGIGTRINGLDYTKDLYSDNNLSLGAGLTLGRGEQDRGSLFRTFNYTTPHGTPGTGFTQVANPENKTFMTGTLHGNANAHIPLGTASWGAQRQGRRNIGAGGVEIAGLNASLEAGLDKFGKGKINPYYDASVGLGMLNNMFNINAGYTNRTGNLQVDLPSGSTAVDTQKGRPYLGVDVQAPLYIDNKGNTRFKVFGGYGAGRGDNSGYAGATYTFANGGPITNYSPSSNFGAVLSKNNSHMHGFANGGPVGMYGFGSTIKDIGYGMADTSLGTIGGLTGIQSMQDIIDEDQYSNDKFDDVTNFASKSLSTAPNFIPGAQSFLMATRGIGSLANTIGKIDERNYDPSKHTSKLDQIGNFVQGAGNIASSFVNPMGAVDTLSKGAKTAMNVGKIAGLGATGINATRDVIKSKNKQYDPTNLLNLGMGVARSGFFGGNTKTTAKYPGNTKDAVDYTPTMDIPLYAAMGGAVNAPNMMKYNAGSNVPNQDNTSLKDQYNLLLKAKPVTKYFSPAMPFHPKDGSMDPRGTVVGSIDPQTGEPIEINIEKNEARWKLPNKTDFITTKKDTDKILAFDKNGDDIAKVTAMLNTTFDKNKKAAKESMMRQGGMVGQYGYGGGVKMYGGGNSVVGIPSQPGPVLNLRQDPYYYNPNMGFEQTDFYTKEKFRARPAYNIYGKGTMEDTEMDNYNFIKSQSDQNQSVINPYIAYLMQPKYDDSFDSSKEYLIPNKEEPSSIMIPTGRSFGEDGAPYAEENYYVSAERNPFAEEYVEPSSLLTSQLTPNVRQKEVFPVLTPKGVQMLSINNFDEELRPSEKVNLEAPKLLSGDDYTYPDEIPYRLDSGETWGTQPVPVYNPNNIVNLPKVTTNVNTNYGKSEGKYRNEIPFRVEKGENWGGQTNYKKERKGSKNSKNNADDASTDSWFSRNKEDLGTAANRAIMYSPALYNFARSIGKPFQMNAADYQVKEDIKPYEEEYRPDYRPYNAAVANLNRMPGSANLAARTNLFNAMQQQQDDARFKIGLGNAQRKMDADQSRLTRKEKDLNIAMQIAQFNEQNRAAGRNMLGQGFTDASQIAQFERFNAMTGNALGSILQHYTMLPDGTMIPKAGYNPIVANSIFNTGQNPLLISPNRYINQGVGIRTNNRAIPDFRTIDPNQFNLFDK